MYYDVYDKRFIDKKIKNKNSDFDENQHLAHCGVHFCGKYIYRLGKI